jgi:multiple sugar transport system substrate-binding protein
MQPKRSFQMVSLMALLTLILAACGVSTESQGGASTGSAAPAASEGAAGSAAPAVSEGAAASSAATGETTTIRWRTRPSDAAEQAVYQELADSATEALSSQGITVQYDPSPNDGNYFTKLKTELASGTAPDIFWIGAVELADFVNTGKVLDIKPFIDADSEFNLDDFYPQTIEELSRDGKVYGLPRDVSTMVTYYNADLFEQAGLPTPKELAEQGNWNWDTFLQSAEALTDESNQQYGVGFGNWWGPGWGYFVHAAGGSPFNEDRTACALDTPEAIAGATYVRNLYEQQLLPASDAESENLFNAGKIGMYLNGRWFTPGVRQNASFNWDVAEMPEGETKSTWLFWGPYLINADTTSPEAAWQVLKQITSAESMAKVAEMGTNIPARKNQEAVDVFLNSTPPENNQAFIAGTEYAVAEAPVWEGNWADFSSGVQSLWDQMIAGQITPEEFGQQACEQTASTFNQ